MDDDEVEEMFHDHEEHQQSEFQKRMQMESDRDITSAVNNGRLFNDFMLNVLNGNGK